MGKVMLGIVLLSFGMVRSQTVFGKWKTIDDKTGIEKAVVEIYEKKGIVHGQIVQILEKGRENERCHKCKGKDKGRPIVGITVIKGMQKTDDGKYKKGRLFDPEYGVEVRGKIWLDPENQDRLIVRGYLAFLYRTQTWIRIKS